MSDPRALLDTYGEGLDPKGEGNRMEAALRAVLDLHQPENFGSPRQVCTDCSTNRPVEAWPCDTVQAITAALEAK